jgi:NAD(P)-dependent dehydrogenase (short-subunit alcohol dehydrogenase family)
MSKLIQLMSLKNRYALVTGANSPLGKIIAKTLAELGAHLILVDHPQTNFDNLVNEIKNDFKINIYTFYCNFEIQENIDDLISSVIEKKFPMNILVNNAAFTSDTTLNGWITDFQKQTIETWKKAIDVNLTSVFTLCQGLSPILKKSKGANIINVGSIYGILAPDYKLYEGTSMNNPAAYAASKGGLIQLTRWLATTLASNIRVNSISPGGIYRNQPETFIKKYNDKTPLNRMAREDDFRGIIAYLASDLSSYVTGQNIAIDGGWSIW